MQLLQFSSDSFQSILTLRWNCHFNFYTLNCYCTVKSYTYDQQASCLFTITDTCTNMLIYLSPSKLDQIEANTSALSQDESNQRFTEDPLCIFVLKGTESHLTFWQQFAFMPTKQWFLHKWSSMQVPQLYIPLNGGFTSIKQIIQIKLN